jgi:hypothetical protein
MSPRTMRDDRDILVLMKITRRKLAAALLAPAAAEPGQAQTAPADEVEAARARVKANAEAVAKVELPMSTEPAFHFEA